MEFQVNTISLLIFDDKHCKIFHVITKSFLLIYLIFKESNNDISSVLKMIRNTDCNIGNNKIILVKVFKKPNTSKKILLKYQKNLWNDHKYKVSDSLTIFSLSL
jgi:hypothetical protein